jgi:hypothetical protein
MEEIPPQTAIDLARGGVYWRDWESTARTTLPLKAGDVTFADEGEIVALSMIHYSEDDEEAITVYSPRRNTAHTFTLEEIEGVLEVIYTDPDFDADEALNARLGLEDHDSYAIPDDTEDVEPASSQETRGQSRVRLATEEDFQRDFGSNPLQIGFPVTAKNSSPGHEAEQLAPEGEDPTRSRPDPDG